jgi:hypothetical protein
MTRSRSFQTAAARRRLDPIVWIIDDITIRLRATIDLADIADALHEIQQPIPEGENQVKAAASKRGLLVQTIGAFVEPDDLEAFRRLEPDLDLQLLAELLGEAIGEYTGSGNPTQEPSSSPGS